MTIPSQRPPAVDGIVKSVSSNEDEILLGIMRLHNEGKPFDADVTFSVGGFYRGSVPEPCLKFDIAPVRDDVKQADVRCLPLAEASISSVVCDLPFMFAPHGTAKTKNAAAGRYTMFETWDDLVSVYRGALKEFRRVLRKGGIVAFKCQDYTDARTTITHCLVYQWAVDEGFYVKDLFVRYRLFGPAYNPDLRQKHARKYHSYWYVLEKSRVQRTRICSPPSVIGTIARAQAHLCSREGEKIMGKRSNFAHRKDDAYFTQHQAALPLGPWLQGLHTFAEPCDGGKDGGDLVRHIESFGLKCVYRGDITTGQDALARNEYGGADIIITNPPHTRALMHPLIEHFAQIAPTWLLIDSDWANNQHAVPYLPMCTDIIPIGRGGQWIVGSAHTSGLNNFAWYRFDAAHDSGPKFHWRGATPAPIAVNGAAIAPVKIPEPHMNALVKPAQVKQAHSPVGGSSARRVIHCPGSVREIARVPEELRRTSVYAERGTALHEATALLIADIGLSIESFVGKTFGNYTITIEDVESSLRPALTFANSLLNQPGAEFYIEKRVSFPTLTSVFGTVDLIIRIGRTIHIIDFKYGSGVRVHVLYHDVDNDVYNSQLVFYTAATRHSLEHFCAGADKFIITIVQPQSIEPDAEIVSSTDITHAELDEFIAIYRDACARAFTADAPLARGDWCKFCAARPICPEHTKPLLDLARFTVPAPINTAGFFFSPTAKEDYLKTIATGLDLVESIKDIDKALRDQARAAIECNNNVPGYVLSAGRMDRHWLNSDHTTIAALMAAGLKREDIVEESLRTPRQTEIRAKARGIKTVPLELITSRRSGNSLVKAENAHAPILGRDALAQAFAESLETLNIGKQKT
jgi:hypothetical protein